jgi:hypothetical protein
MASSRVTTTADTTPPTELRTPSDDREVARGTHHLCASSAVITDRRWRPASRSRRSWRRAQQTRIPKPVEASQSRGDRAAPVDSVCPGDSVNYPGALGFPPSLPQTARCALDANPPPGPSLTSKVQLLPGSEYRPLPARPRSPRSGSCPRSTAFYNVTTGAP